MVQGTEKHGAAGTASGDVGAPRKGEAHGIPGGRSSSATRVTGNTRRRHSLLLPPKHRVGNKAMAFSSPLNKHLPNTDWVKCDPLISY